MALQLKEIIEDISLNSSSKDILSGNKRWLNLISQQSGIPIIELQEMIRSGVIDNFLSDGFFALSLLAVNHSIEAIQMGEMPVEKLPDIALKSADLGRKLAGRDIKKTMIIDSDMWQKAIETVEKEEIEVKGETLDD